jgi:hypothetical protein
VSTFALLGLLLAGALVLPLTACEQKPAAEPQRPTPPAVPASAGDADGALPPGHPPVESAAAEQPPASTDALLPPGHPPLPTPTGSSASAKQASPAKPAAGLPAGHPPLASPGGIEFDAPPEWASKPITSPMRTAHYLLPRAEGDAEDGELIVFYFGPREGGPVEANLTRWRGMFTTREGEPLPADAGRRETFEAGGLKVTLLDIAGRYAPSPMPGMAAKTPRDESRMIAAVVETARGPYFFKATGPAATIEAHAQSIRAALESVRP